MDDMHTQDRRMAQVDLKVCAVPNSPPREHRIQNEHNLGVPFLPVRFSESVSLALEHDCDAYFHVPNALMILSMMMIPEFHQSTENSHVFNVYKYMYTYM